MARAAGPRRSGVRPASGAPAKAAASGVVDESPTKLSTSPHKSGQSVACPGCALLRSPGRGSCSWESDSPSRRVRPARGLRRVEGLGAEAGRSLLAAGWRRGARPRGETAVPALGHAGRGRWVDMTTRLVELATTGDLA